MKKIFWIFMIAVIVSPCWAQDFFILGDKQGDAGLLYPRHVKEGPDGNIYIYDEQVAFIKVFSPGGEFLRKMGGKGEGPGEFKRSDDVYFNFTHDGKLLYFTEFFGGHRWITFMNLSGKLHDVLKLKMETRYAITHSLQLKDGSILACVSYSCNPEAKQDFYLYRCSNALAVINPKGELESEFLKKENVERISSISSGADMGIPFTPSYRWILLKNGTIVFTEGLSTTLDIYDMSGKITGKIKTPLAEPQPVTEKDLDQWRTTAKNAIRDKDWFNRFGKVIYKYKKSIYPKKPNISEMSLTPGENLLIRGRKKTGEAGGLYWLIDLKGNILTQVKITGSIYGVEISPHFIFARAFDEDDNFLIFCLKRKGSEAEDLGRLAAYKATQVALAAQEGQ